MGNFLSTLRERGLGGEGVFSREMIRNKMR
jgi:hypothetical protein